MTAYIHVVHTHPCTTPMCPPLPTVRHKAKDIISFLQDDERLREARKAAKSTRDKYVGYSSEEAHGRYSECMSISRVPSSLLRLYSPSTDIYPLMFW